MRSTFLERSRVVRPTTRTLLLLRRPDMRPVGLLFWGFRNQEALVVRGFGLGRETGVKGMPPGPKTKWSGRWA